MTVIELAFTITVLGVVMFFGVRGGDALMQSARAFMVSRDFERIRSSVSFYEAQYGQLPGNDWDAAARWDMPRPTSTVSGIQVSFEGDSAIHGLLSEPLNPNGEPYMAWRHLRAAGLIGGDPKIAGASAMPENAFGGFFAFDEGNLGQKGGSLCATRIPGKAAQFIDERLDDGIINEGKVVATSQRDPVVAHDHFDKPDAEPYNVEKEYIICVPMLP